TTACHSPSGGLALEHGAEPVAPDLPSFRPPVTHRGRSTRAQGQRFTCRTARTCPAASMRRLRVRCPPATALVIAEAIEDVWELTLLPRSNMTMSAPERRAWTAAAGTLKPAAEIALALSESVTTSPLKPSLPRSS